MSSNHEELRDELLAAVRARRDLTKEDEEYLVGAFLDRLDQQLDARIDAHVDARLASTPPTKRGNRSLLAQNVWILPAALGIAIPLTAIATTVGLIAVIVVWIGIVSVVGIAAGNTD